MFADFFHSTKPVSVGLTLCSSFIFFPHSLFGSGRGGVRCIPQGRLAKYSNSTAVVLSKQILSKNSCKWWVIVDNTLGGEITANKIRITEILCVSPQTARFVVEETCERLGGFRLGEGHRYAFVLIAAQSRCSLVVCREHRLAFAFFKGSCGPEVSARRRCSFSFGYSSRKI